LKERHTGENIAEALRTAINEWKIDENRISAIVCDNTSYIFMLLLRSWADVMFTVLLTPAISHKQWIRYWQCNEPVACKLVGHFKHSPLAMTALKGKQKQLSVCEHHLVDTFIMREKCQADRLVLFLVSPLLVPVLQ